MNDRPKLATPPGACDTHMHIYEAGVAGAPGAPLPGVFAVADYRKVQERLGFERVVVVQPNAYADDNSVTLRAIRDLGAGARGVAVVGPDVAESELERLTKGGMRAVRIITLHGGLLGFDVMDAVMARVHSFGWHANIQLDGRELPRFEAHIRRLGQLARALIRHAPERVLYARNWPHPSARKPAPPDDGALLDLLLDWAPEAATRRKILVDNPAELYGFR